MDATNKKEPPFYDMDVILISAIAALLTSQHAHNYQPYHIYEVSGYLRALSPQPPSDLHDMIVDTLRAIPKRTYLSWPRKVKRLERIAIIMSMNSGVPWAQVKGRMMEIAEDCDQFHGGDQWVKLVESLRWTSGCWQPSDGNVYEPSSEAREKKVGLQRGREAAAGCKEHGRVRATREYRSGSSERG